MGLQRKSYRVWIIVLGLALPLTSAWGGDLPYNIIQEIIPGPVPGVNFEARLYTPKNHPKDSPLIITVSQGPSEATADPYTKLHADVWARKGIAVLAYNMRGVGKSTGEPNEDKFDERAIDTLSIYRFARSLPGVNKRAIGVAGFIQGGGWVVPKFAKLAEGLRFIVLVSPAGVNPAQLVEHILSSELIQQGLTKPEAAKAAEVWHNIGVYYATSKGYETAQAAVDAVSKSSWYPTAEKHPFWHDMAAPGRVYDPEGLKQAIKDKPGDFTWLLLPSSFADYQADYAAIHVPTLVVYGGHDTYVPIQKSQAIFENALHHPDIGVDITFKTFPDGDHNLQSSSQTLASGYTEFVANWVLTKTGANLR